MGKYTFRKEERLKSEKHIQELFKKGSSFYMFPFKVIFMVNHDPEVRAHQVLITVPGKNFKRAVDRNLIKRRIREAYRLQKEILEDLPKFIIAFVYTHKEILAFGDIQKPINRGLSKISKIPFEKPKTS
jgi:ribonuclease P protein component